MQAALASQAALEAGHLPVIVLVIIAKKVQKAMQGEHPQLGLQGVPRLAGLPARNTNRNNDIAQKPALCCGLAAPKRRRGEGGKRQDVGWRISSAVLPVQRADARVGDERDRDLPPRAGRRRRREPGAKARGPSTPLGAGA